MDSESNSDSSDAFSDEDSLSFAMLDSLSLEDDFVALFSDDSDKGVSSLSDDNDVPLDAHVFK